MSVREGIKLVSCGESVKIWTFPEFYHLHEFSPKNAPYFRSVSWSTDGSALVSVPVFSKTVTLTNLSSKKNVYNTEINIGERTTCAKFNRDMKNVLVGCSNGTIVSWNINQKKVIKTYKGQTREINCLHINSINSHIAAGSESGDITIYNLTSGMYGAKLTSEDRQAVKCLRFSALKKSLLASTSDNGSVYLWDVNSKKMIHKFANAHDATATAVTFSPINTSLFISSGLDKKLNICNLNSKRIVQTWTSAFPVASMELLDDGRTLVVGGSKGYIAVYDLRAAKAATMTISAHKTTVRDLESKKFSLTSKSEEAIACEVPVVAHSLSTSNALVYNCQEIQTDRENSVFSSPDSDVFSPVREDQGVATLDNAEVRCMFYSHSSGEPSPSDYVVATLTHSRKSDPFSPAREDHCAATLDNAEVRCMSYSHTGTESSPAYVCATLNGSRRSDPFSSARATRESSPFPYQSAATLDNADVRRLSYSHTGTESSPSNYVYATSTLVNGRSRKSDPFPPAEPVSESSPSDWIVSESSPSDSDSATLNGSRKSDPFSPARKSTDILVGEMQTLTPIDASTIQDGTYYSVTWDKKNEVCINMNNNYVTVKEQPIVDGEGSEPSCNSTPDNHLFDTLDTDTVTNRWQTSPPKFFSRDMDLPNIAPQLCCSHGSSNDNDDEKPTIHTPPSNDLIPANVLDESRVKTESSPFQQMPEGSETKPPQVFQPEFFAQLLEDKLEDMQFRMQQQYFIVLAQLVKQHIEMKEELDMLKDKLNMQSDLQEEIRKLRAENIRLRTAM